MTDTAASPLEQQNQTPPPAATTPKPEPLKKVQMPGFSSATTDPTTPPSRPAAATAGGATAAGTSPTTNDGPPERNSSAEESPRESSPGEEATPTGKPMGRKNFEKAIGTAIVAGAKIAHSTLAKSEEEQELLMYLADDHDVAGMSGPAASILSRRGVGGNVGAETSDLIELGFAVAEYVSKQIGKFILIRQFRKAKEAGEIPPEAHISAYLGNGSAA